MNATTSATCETCNTLFTDLPFELDETGGVAVLELTPCTICGAMLCPCCSRVDCDSCGDAVCSEHITLVEDGTPKPLRCCTACAVDFAAQDLEPALCCPECLGTDLVGVRHEIAACAETGYQDAGEQFVCRSCGHQGDEGELVPLTAIERKGAGRAAAAVPAIAIPDEAA